MTAGDEDKRRVSKPHVPARVAARVFVARRQQHPAVAIERVNNRFDCPFDRNAFNDTADIDTTTSAVGIGAGDMGCSASHSSLLHCGGTGPTKQQDRNLSLRGGGPKK